jgi:hypothetical protein
MYHNVPGWVGRLPEVTQKLGHPPRDFAEYRSTLFGMTRFGTNPKTELTPARFNRIFDQAEILGNKVSG